MNSHPRVSVVIATYNYGCYIRGAIESVLAQTLQDFEIIVVDDGSIDETPELVRPFLDDARVRYLRTDHLGQPAAKNAGIRAATGRYVAFLDADDLWLPTKLEKQVALFERSGPEVGVVICRRRWIDEQGNLLPYGERSPQRGDVLAQIFHRPFICFSSSMIHRDVLEDVGLFDESIPMSIDYDLWLRIALRYHFDFVDDPLVLYRTGHANLSTRLSERIWCVRKIIYRFLDELGGRARLDPSFVRMVLAEHCCDIAVSAGQGRPWFRFLWYLRALGYRPHHAPAWRELALGWCPGRVKSLGRRLLRGLRRPPLYGSPVGRQG
jgi:glycosyltransferase involved in cell wall biosynthesis